MFKNVYFNKKVLITGHTGFKGSWLTTWLLRLGAKIVGISKDVPTQPSLFEILELADRIAHYIGDIRDLAIVKEIIHTEKPDFIFHLAAQAIVSVSYQDPCETITTNTLGTMNVLEALREINYPCIVVLVTSDKSYNNVEWIWGYRENDSMGGNDVYSGSKGAAELLIKCYVQSFFMHNTCPVRIGIGRAGNVIGGGDWAKDRIVVDIVKAWQKNAPVNIRSPKSTRPWQHVLEPLSGYLNLGQVLTEQPKLHGEAFNFGPRSEQNRTVIDLIKSLSQYWKFLTPHDIYKITDDIPFHEASLLKLNCDKALFYLKWEANLNYQETIEMVATWYSSYVQKIDNMRIITEQQLATYETKAIERGQTWIS